MTLDVYDREGPYQLVQYLNHVTMAVCNGKTELESLNVLHEGSVVRQALFPSLS